MKLFKSLFVAICSLYLLKVVKTNPIDKETYIPSDDEIRQKIEEFREMLKTGNDTLGIPNCNPLDIEHLDLDMGALTNETVSGQLTFDGLLLDGLPSFEFTFKRVLSKITFTLDVDLTFNTEYDVSVLLFDFIEIYGTGSISIELKGIQAEVILFIGSMDPLEASKAVVTLLVNDANIKITGLLNDEETSEIISNDLSEDLPQLLADNKDLVTEKISPIILDLFNQYVGLLTGEGN